MGIMRENSIALHEQMEAKEKIRKTLAEQEKQRVLDEYMARDAIAEAAQKKIDDFYRYKDNVKKTLVTEALNNICINCMNNPSQYETSVMEALVGQYIQDRTPSALLKTMKNSRNGFLRHIYEEAEKAEKDIEKDANKDDETTLTIDKNKIDDFWKEIDNSEDLDDVTNMIRLRVANAEEEFVNRNLQDKNNIDTILKDTADRVQNAKSGYDNEFGDQVEESETRIAKDKIYSIQHESRRNVFDRMVSSLAEAVMRDDSARSQFVLENSRLDMNKIVECARCMYTLLEVVSTIQLEKVDDKYIEDTLNSIKR